MKTVGRVLSCLCAVLLAFAAVAGYFGFFFHHALSSEAFYRQPARQIRSEQIARMEQFVNELSETYGIAPDTVLREVNAETLDRYGGEVIAFLGSLLEEQEEDAELIFPYYMTETLLDNVRDDEGFQKKVEKNLQRTVSQNDIVTPVELLATKLIFPIRPQMVIAGYNAAAERVDIPKLAGLTGKWWILPLGCIGLIFLILLFDHRRFAAWTGSGLIGASLMTGAILAFLRALHLSSLAGQINELFAAYLQVMWRNIWMTASVFSAVMLLLGMVLICMHGHALRKKA